MFHKRELSDGRIIEYRQKEELFIINTEKISVKYLKPIKEYLTYFPGTVYLENGGGILEGIMTSAEISKSITLKRVEINTNFFRVEKYNEKSDYLENFFDRHQNIRSLPLIDEGKLLGEFVLHLGRDNPFDKMHWKPISASVKRCLAFLKGEKQVIAIPATEECIELKEILLELDNVVVTDVLTKDVDLYIGDRKAIQENLKALIEGRTEIGAHFINIYNLYRRSLLSHILKTCKERSVAFYYFEAPMLEKLGEIDDIEMKELLEKVQFETIIENEQILDEFYKESKSRCYIKNGDYKHVSLLDNGRYFQLCDYHGDYLNIVDGKRYTCNNPESYQSTVHMFGNCVARGHCVCDEETIESFLQTAVNRDFPETYKIVNYGIKGRIGNLNDFQYMLYTPMREQDIIVTIGNYEEDIVEIFREYGVFCYELSGLFNGQHEYGRWFLDNTCHINHVANKVIADYILDNIQGQLKSNRFACREYFWMSEDEPDITVVEKDVLLDYIENIRSYCKDLQDWRNGIIGAIVMNCNPFTKGHQYLIEQSALQVDTLFVFVVEEDKSYFPFKDRISLVREGTKEYKNVIVVPSGRFMISSMTFPEYFNKNQLQDISIDASQDIRIFGKYIAPELNITVRFVGEEPFDKVTASYNHSMKEILPEYGVRLVEIPRKCFEDRIISASCIRKLLEKSEWSQIEQMVPSITYQYLKNAVKENRIN